MRKFLLLLTAFFVTMVMNAGKVTQQEALQKARQFMKGKRLLPLTEQGRTRTVIGDGTLHIFNAENKGGFIIISGDDRTEAILGYATEGEINLDNMPVNLQEWLEGYSHQIKALPDNYPPQPQHKTRAVGSAIKPLVTARWDQGSPYNLRCPKDPNTQKLCVTGCVATAMAQVMYYYKSPASTSTIIPSYTTNDINLEELPVTTFQWDKMKDTYSENETGDAAYAVAELMRYCGQSVKMGYTSDESGANSYLIADALATYFGYSKNAKNVSRKDYSTTDWEELVYNELASNRPVLYSGSSNSVGHQFVCDGYDSNGNFHLNWGWGGQSDGYFVLSLANPSDKGIGGGTGSDGFSQSQMAIIGVKPAEEGENAIPTLQSHINDEFTEAEYTRNGSGENFTDVKITSYYEVHYDVAPTSEYHMQIGLGLYQDGTLKQTLFGDGVTINQTDIPTTSYRIYGYTTTLSFGANLADGTYQLRQIYRESDSDDWTPMNPVYLVATISDNSLTIRQSNPNVASFKVNSITFSDDPEVGKAVEVTVNITNTGETNQETVYLWINEELTTSVTGSVEPGKTGDVVLHFTPQTAGTYTAEITSANNRENILGTKELTIAAAAAYTLTGTCTIKGQLENGEIEGKTVYATIVFKNEGEKTYKDYVLILLMRNTEGNIYSSVGDPQEKYTTLNPGETVTYEIQFSDLNNEDKYMLAALYFSQGSQVWCNETGQEREMQGLFELASPVPVKIGSTGVSTFSSKYNVVAADDVKVYKGKLSNDKLVLTEIEDKIIPANTGVILEGTAGSYSFETNPTDNTVSGNDLKAVPESGYTVTSDDIYALANKKSDGVGFYKVNNGVTISSGKAYLQVSGSASTRGFYSVGGGTTGIWNALRNTETDNDIYNLNGQRVNTPTKGIYIKNGKKIIIK